MAPKIYPLTFANKTLKRCVPACSGFVLACLLAFALQIFFFSPISPDLLELPPASSASHLPTNSYLQSVVKLGEGLLKNPEDVWVDAKGVLYTATGDGWIKRMLKNGTWQDWKKIDSNTLVGITITKENDLIVCDAEKGLLKVNEDGVTVLASHFKGSQIRLADDVIATSDGSLYFSVASTKFGIHQWRLDVLEAKPHGQVLKYDPLLNETSLVLDGLAFPNGVALSREEDYLVFCETWKFRCRKYWLKGETKGETETLIENLPGGPDNINLAPDGSFWIALVQLHSERLKFAHTSKASKHFLAAFPKLLRLTIPLHKKASVVNVAADGTIIRKFDDPNGKVMNSVTNAIEYDNYLYLGSVNSNFIGKLPLKTA